MFLCHSPEGISQENLKVYFLAMSLKIINSRLCLLLPGVNEFSSYSCHPLPSAIPHKGPYGVLPSANASTVHKRNHIHQWVNSLWPRDAIYNINLANIGSGNGFLPNGTKPLPEPMLINLQWHIVTYTGQQLHRVPKLLSYSHTAPSPSGQWVNQFFPPHCTQWWPSVCTPPCTLNQCQHINITTRQCIPHSCQITHQEGMLTVHA